MPDQSEFLFLGSRWLDLAIVDAKAGMVGCQSRRYGGKSASADIFVQFTLPSAADGKACTHN